MTRESKIGLLVGLAFIIVIGILLADLKPHQPQGAPLMGVSEHVRNSALTPGGPSNGQGGVIIHGQFEPDRRVVINEHQRTPGGSIQVNIDGPRGSRQIEVVDNHSPNAQPDQSRRSIAETIQDLIDQGELRPVDRTTTPTPSDRAGLTAVREYQAQAGDTLSRMAARLLGENTTANRQAIMALNPSLQQNPDRVIVGETYRIPAAAQAASAPLSNTTPAPAPNRVAAAERTYTTRPGDSLWRIAMEQVGSPGAVSTIREMNQEVLRGGDTIHPNMTLRLPPRSVQ